MSAKLSRDDLSRRVPVTPLSHGGQLLFVSTDSGDGSCVAMTSGQVGGFWDDKPCTDKYKFMCEKFRPDISPPTEAPTPPPSQGCADGWTAKPHFRNCYRVKKKLAALIIWQDCASVTDSTVYAYCSQKAKLQIFGDFGKLNIEPKRCILVGQVSCLLSFLYI